MTISDRDLKDFVLKALESIKIQIILASAEYCLNCPAGKKVEKELHSSSVSYKWLPTHRISSGGF